MTNNSLEEVRRNNLRRLLNPDSIAVVGASNDQSKAGYQAVRVMSGFPGRLVAVNPREKEIQGFPCFPSILAIPEAVDLAVLAIPASHCIAAAREAAAKGIGGIFIISGGFGETGEEGAKLQDELGEICRDTGLRLLGPNTSGFANPYKSCPASFAPGVDTLQKGRVCTIAQSGGVNLSLAFTLRGLGEGVSLAVGLGNGVDVGPADVLEMVADDPNTSAIILGLEGIPQGRKLFDALRRVTPRKPVVALPAGRAYTGQLVVSHTGNLMGLYERSLAALTQAGAVVVQSTEEAAQAASVLACGRLPPKQKSSIALVTGQAGPALLIMDGLTSAGIDVPELGADTIKRIEALLPPMTFVRNPVDTGRPTASFPTIVETTAEDERIDAVLAWALGEQMVVGSTVKLVDPASLVVPAKKKTGKPVVYGTLGPLEVVGPAVAALKEDGVPGVLGPERVVSAAAALTSDARAAWRLSQSPAPRDACRAGSALSGLFDEDRSKQLLAEYGIASPRRVLCGSRDEAVAAFRKLSKPVVAKIAAADIAHKTEVGGVRLNITDEQQLVAALDHFALIPTKYPGQVLLEEMALDGIELIVGGVQDPSWGPCVMIGLGGILAEAMRDTAIRLAPVTPLDVEEMLDSLRGRKLLGEFRGRPACDRNAIIQVVTAMSQLLVDHPEIREVEINPLRASAGGALALDALVVLGDAKAGK